MKDLITPRTMQTVKSRPEADTAFAKEPDRVFPVTCFLTTVAPSPRIGQRAGPQAPPSKDPQRTVARVHALLLGPSPGRSSCHFCHPLKDTSTRAFHRHTLKPVALGSG